MGRLVVGKNISKPFSSEIKVEIISRAPYCAQECLILSQEPVRISRNSLLKNIYDTEWSILAKDVHFQ